MLLKTPSAVPQGPGLAKCCIVSVSDDVIKYRQGCVFPNQHSVSACSRHQWVFHFTEP